MSKDARNSLIAWGAVLAMCLLFWLGSDYLPMLPDFPRWVDYAVFALIPISLVWEVVRSIRADRREKSSG
jgi:apolipoprotein N-acyltransferase